MKWYRMALMVFSVLATVAGSSFADINQDIFTAVAVGNLDQVKSLLNQGADVNAKGPGGLPVLTIAAMDGQTDVVKLLLEKGADVNAESGNGGTALIYAAMRGRANVAEMLLAHGADVNAKSDTGNTAIMWANKKQHADVVKVLIAHGAKETDAVAHDMIEQLTTRMQALSAATKEATNNTTALKQAQPQSGSKEESEGQASTPNTVHSDVDKPKYAVPENLNNFAVVIGVEKYGSLPSAQFADRDAEAVRSHLVALGYPMRNIFFLSDQQATRAKISQSVNTWLPNRVNEKSTIFFYYSGHGAPDTKTNQTYIVGTDGDPEDLESTAYPVKTLYAKLGGLKARQVIVALDSCFSGAGGRSVLPKGARPLVGKIDMGIVPEKLVVLTASDKDQISGTLDEQGHGTFTYYLLKGLDGAAQDGSGKVTVRLLYKYMVPKVQDAARLHNRDQTPQLLPADSESAGIRLR